MENSHRIKDDYLLAYNVRVADDVIEVESDVDDLTNTMPLIAMLSRIYELSQFYKKPIRLYVKGNELTCNWLKSITDGLTNIQVVGGA